MNSWEKMDDLDRIDLVIEAASKDYPARRPTYDYLVKFIDELGSSYEEAIIDRRYLSYALVASGVIMLVLIMIAVTGWIR